jgi:hypothetical protein
MVTKWGARFSRFVSNKKAGRTPVSFRRHPFALPRVEQLEDRTVPTILLPVSNHRDLVYDPVRNLLDITTTNGLVQQYSLKAQTLLQPLAVGGVLAGADISADGNSLVVADQGFNNAQFLHRINLNTFQDSPIIWGPFSTSDPTWDVAMGPGTKGLFDDTSATVPVRVEQADINTGALTFRRDAPGSKGPGLIGSGSLIHRSADRSTFLIADTASSAGTLFTYNALTDTFSKPIQLGFPLSGATTAVNRNGTLFAVQVKGATFILNQQLVIVNVLQGLDGGVAFDPTQDVMYAVSSSQGMILAFNTNTWATTYQTPVGEMVPPGTPLGNGTMTVTTNGWLFLATPSGVRGYQLPPTTAASFAITGAPASTTAGQPFQFTVTALDSNGQPIPNYIGTVHFTTTDYHSWLVPADYTFAASENSSHTFTMSYWQAGPETISVVDTRNASAKATSPVDQVQPGPSQYFTTTYWGNSTYGEAAGYSFPFSIQVCDSYGNITPNYTGTVHFTSSDPAAQLPADYTYTAADKGVHVFYPTLNTAGYQSITAKDFAVSTLNQTMSNIQVTNIIPGLHFTITPASPSVTAGVASSYTVTAWDYNNQVATHYVGTVTFSSTDAGSGVVLPANYTFTAADAGVHTFSATFTTAGSRTLSLRDTAWVTSGGGTGGGTSGGGTGGSTPTGSTTVTVIPGAASTFKVAGFPTAVTAGTSGNVTVSAYDPYGNVATGYSGTLHFSSSDGQVSLPADSGLTNGTGSFAATLKTVGSQSLTVTDLSNSALTGTQGGIAVSPAAASSFQLTGFPTSTTAGVAGTVTVTAYDPYGNVATGYGGTVHFTSSDSQATLPTDGPLTNGAATFSVTLFTAGAQSLTVTDTANAALNGTEAGISVSPAAAALLVLNAPGTVTAGVAFSFTVTLEDSYGNVATGYTGTVRFSSSDALAGLPADYSFTAADAGTASFTTVFNTVGSQTLTASDDADGLTTTLGVLVLGS